MIPAVTAAEARALDRITMERVGVPGVVLMETAGRGVATVVAERATTRPGPIAVVCGGGGNGGDGLVAARALRAVGLAATAYLVVPRERVGGDAAVHLGIYERSGAPLVVIDDLAEGALTAALAGAAIVVDAVLGTGVTRDLTGHLAAVIAAINAAPGYRVAIDVPSGIDADTGWPHGVAVRADTTVTMQVPKLGIAVAPGCAAAGQVVSVDIGVPPSVIAEVAPAAHLVEARDVAAWRRVTSPLTHKTRRGHVLVVAGSPGKRGAARLTSVAALRAGAGLVTLATAGDPDAPDPVMTVAVATGADVTAAAAGKHAIAIGPGMPDGADGAAWVAAALATGLPCVVDATGLDHLRGRAPLPPDAAVVLTPHAGEAARLLGTTAAEIEADRPAAVRALVRATGAVVLLKGPRTLVCDRRGHIAINPTGGPALATAGSGDVLTGVIAALLAAGHAPAEAASLGAYLHGAAGDALTARLRTGVMASDLPDAIAALG